MKKLLSIILSVIIIASVFSVSVFSTGAVTTTRLFLYEEHDAQLSSVNDKLYYSFCAPADSDQKVSVLDATKIQLYLSDQIENL